MHLRTDIPQLPITKEIIQEYLPENPTIIEAGAHIGRDTVKMSNRWPQGRIYAFEPVPNLYEQLLERTKEQNNVSCYNLALSDREGETTLYVSSGASTAASSLLEPHEYSIERPNVLFTPIPIKTVTLDQWAHNEGIDHVDFMWLDMQGAEIMALQGATTIFPTCALLVEVSLIERFKGNPLYNELMTWIEQQGFKAVQQDIPKHNKINILFVCRDRLRV